MKEKTLRTRRLAVGLAGLGALGLCGWGALALHAKEADATREAPVALRHEGKRLIVPEQSPLRKSLVVEAVAAQEIAAPFNLPAVVEADPAKLVRVLPPLAGRIVSMNKRLGDEVRAGDVLFTIDSAELTQAMSEAHKAQSALTLARRNLERLRELDKSEIAAKRDLEQAQSDYEQAVSEAARADAHLAQIGAKPVPATQAGGKHLLAVRSAISGRVVELDAATGGYWNDVTAPVMTVADLSQVFVTANAREKELAHLYAGQPASVKLDAWPDALQAKVRYIGEMLDPDTRTVKVRMAFDNRDGRLKPGMFAKATFAGKPREGILAPATAVTLSGFYNRAFVEVAPWQFEARVVELGAQIDDRIEIRAGLKAGERVVVRNGVLLND